MKKYLPLSITLILFLTVSTYAQIDLLKDIYPGKSIGFYPDHLYSDGFFIYYTSGSAVTGYELWRSDGTEGGTNLVKGIFPGSGNSLPDHFMKSGGIIYFSADDGVHGRELWRTNGTSSGTFMVSDIYPGATGSNPTSLTSSNGILYFAATDSIHGTEVWQSDGSQAGTTLVKDVNPGTANGSPAYFTTYNGDTYFFADDGSPGSELWKTNGTSSGTLLVKDVYASSSNSDVWFLMTLNSKLLFGAYDGMEGYKPWVSDGTEAGTVLVKDVNLSFGGNVGPDRKSILNGYLYFAGSETNEYELWRTDGTAEHTEQVAEINPFPGIGSNPLSFIVMDSLVYFSARPDDNAENFQWYRSNGTMGNYTLVDSRFAPGGSPKFPISLNGKILFNGSDGVNGEELYIYNGNTVSLVDLFPGPESSYPTNFVTLSDQVFFSANNGTTRVLFKYDGFSVSEVGSTSIHSSTPDSFTAGKNGITYFVATDENGRELWKTDGTTAGTVLVKNIYPGGGDGSPAWLTEADSLVFFVANDGVHGKELWKSNGTEAGTMMVSDLNTSGDSSPANLTIVNTTLFFTASNGSGTKLWKYSEGTVSLVKDTTRPLSLTAWQSYLYYVDMVNDPVNSYPCGLWRSDGTPEGTVLITDNLQGCIGPSQSSTALAVMDSSLYFAGIRQTYDLELWKYDGTVVSLVKDINTTANASSYPGNFTVLDHSLFFTADDGIHGFELWKTDGDSSNTTLVRDINPGTNPGLFTLPNHGPPYPLVAYLTSYSGKIYFRANDGTRGYELWMSDGSENGTQLAMDMSPGSLSGNPYEFTVHDSLLYFLSSDGISENVYATDGRACTITKLASSAPMELAEPEGLTSSGTKLYVSFLAEGIGREPFVIDPSQVSLLSGCAMNPPLAQPVSLSFSSVTDNEITLSFSEPSGSANDGYISLMQAMNSPYPLDVPVNGTVYHTGDVLGSSTIVVHVGAELSFPVIYLQPDTEYYFAVFAYDDEGGTYSYLTADPLQGSQRTASASLTTMAKRTDAYPNPFQEEVNIPFTVESENAAITISIFDFMGNRVVDLTNDNFKAGYHEVRWNGTDFNGNRVKHGLYSYSVVSDGGSSMRQGKLVMR
jgi:ELWxxDGT repeat protein